MFRAILFDLDDTLYDLRSYWTRRLERAFATVATRYPHIDSAAMLEQALASKVYMEHMPDYLRQWQISDEAFVAAVTEQYRYRWFDELELAEDALATLHELRPHTRLGLITNGPAHTQRPKIERFGLAAHMDTIIVSGEVGVAKPDPKIFMLALAQLGTTPAESLYVGDSIENDLHGAAAAGMPCVWVNRRNEQLPPGAPLPLATITSLAELPLLAEMQVV